MKAVIDTCILVDYLNGIAEGARELGLYEEKIISIITYIEILVGARNEKEEHLLRTFLASFHIRTLSPEIADLSVRLRRQHHLKVPDAVVYATARREGCNLVSRNTKDFSPDWPDVRVPYPSY